MVLQYRSVVAFSHWSSLIVWRTCSWILWQHHSFITNVWLCNWRSKKTAKTGKH